MSIQNVVIVIPTYNEEAVIEDTLTQVFETTKAIPNMDIHVLVFDSASTDKTKACVIALQAKYPRLHLQEEPKKTGLGSAYLQAMRYALDKLHADIVIEFDADLSHQPIYIEPMLRAIETHDVVVGSRYVKGGSIPSHWGWHRKLLSVSGNYLARLVLTSHYKDFTSGFRATRRVALIKALPAAFLSNHYAYKLELFWSLHKNKARIHEYPIVFVDREKGQSKLPANSIFDSLRVLFHLRVRGVQRYLKMCVVGLSGAIIQCLVYNVLREHLPPFDAARYAVIAAIVNNFILNHRFTFKAFLTDRYQKIKAFALFCGYSALMVSLQSHWLQLGVKYLGVGSFKENILMIAGIGLGSILNYLTYSRLVWRQKKRPTPVEDL